MRRADTRPAFADGKAPDALRTIGEVEAALGIKAHVLRYWEEHIPALKPLKRAGGRRLYRPQDIDLLVRIDDLINRRRFTLKGAKAALRSGDDAAEQEVSVSDSGGAHLLPRLKALRAKLAEALVLLPG